MNASNDPTVNAIADQMEAERNEAKQLAPDNRFFLDDPQIRPILDHALAGLDDHEADGPAPIIRSHAGLVGPSVEHTRSGSEPLRSQVSVRYCNVCTEPTSLTIPFWVARGQYIVQIDACDRCSLNLMERGGIPQVGPSVH